jgi:hypothetical protein
MQIKKEEKEIIHFSLEINNYSAVQLKIWPQNYRKGPNLHYFGTVVPGEPVWFKM